MQLCSCILRYHNMLISLFIYLCVSLLVFLSLCPFVFVSFCLSDCLSIKFLIILSFCLLLFCLSFCVCVNFIHYNSIYHPFLSLNIFILCGISSYFPFFCLFVSLYFSFVYYTTCTFSPSFLFILSISCP
jgi:hypothetical protein